MKRKGIIIALLLLGALPLSGCSGAPKAPQAEQSPAPVSQKITAQEAYARMQSEEAYILLDVRTQAEFDAGHIEGALLLPDFEIEQGAKEQLPDLGAQILLYCRSGRRSAEAAKKLSALGYTNVYDFGGIIDWPYATVTE